MNALDTIAAQRDEANTKLRAAIQERDAALAEVQRLKGAGQSVDVARKDPEPHAVPAEAMPRSEVPVVTPQQSKRPRIFGR
jgi:outer membrane protein TolC